MKVQLLQALRQHAEGQIAKHKANIDVYLNNTTGIGEHSDIVETIEKEVYESIPVLACVLDLDLRCGRPSQIRPR